MLEHGASIAKFKLQCVKEFAVGNKVLCKKFASFTFRFEHATSLFPSFKLHSTI